MRYEEIITKTKYAWHDTKVDGLPRLNRSVWFRQKGSDDINEGFFRKVDRRNTWELSKSYILLVVYTGLEDEYDLVEISFSEYMAMEGKYVFLTTNDGILYVHLPEDVPEWSYRPEYTEVVREL